MVQLINTSPLYSTPISSPNPQKRKFHLLENSEKDESLTSTALSVASCAAANIPPIFNHSIHPKQGGKLVLCENGILYRGCWKKKKPHGVGTSWFPNGAKYEGEWLEGKRHGYGTIWFPDGIQYEGRWARGKPQGKGQSFFPNGQIEYDGQWKDGEKNGLGKLYSDKGELEYSGQMKSDKAHGVGSKVFPNGMKYRGEWEKGKMNGKGRLYYPIENVESRENQKNRQYTSNNRQLAYFGNFKDGEPYGQGQSYFFNGENKNKDFWSEGLLLDITASLKDKEATKSLP